MCTKFKSKVISSVEPKEITRTSLFGISCVVLLLLSPGSKVKGLFIPHFRCIQIFSFCKPLIVFSFYSRDHCC